MNNGNAVAEKAILGQLGLRKTILCKLRMEQMEKDVDWNYGNHDKGHAVFYTAEGVKKLYRLLGIDDRDAPRTVTGPTLAEVVVVREPVNPRLMICERADGHKGGEVIKGTPMLGVRVRDSGTFTIGMNFVAAKDGDGTWQFWNRAAEAGGNEHTIGRLPRKKGRW